MKFKLLFSYRFLLFILSVLGVYLQLTKHGGFGMMLYYTILSNMLVMFFMGDMVWRMVRGRSTQTQGYLRMKGAVTMSIMITCVIYHFMLAPLATPEKFYRLENFLCHYIVPLMFFFDTLVIDKAKQYRKLDPFLWTSIPLAYMLFALLNGLVLKWPIPGAKDSPFAYFFINAYQECCSHWCRLYWYRSKWVVIIFIAYLLAGYVLYWIKNIKRKSAVS